MLSKSYKINPEIQKTRRQLGRAKQGNSKTAKSMMNIRKTEQKQKKFGR